MREFDFPTNIKQIGTIEPGLRIYMEDYVSTYLTQYAGASGYDERLATLVGRHMTIDGTPIVFISGAILGKFTEEDKGVTKFSDKSLAYVEEQLSLHFKGMEVVGWMQSQPGYGTFLNPNYKAYHKETFKGPHHVMFVMDPLEKISSFYINNNGELEESGGYFIYYEKNHPMHEYMLENKIVNAMRTINDEQEYPHIFFDDGGGKKNPKEKNLNLSPPIFKEEDDVVNLSRNRLHAQKTTGTTKSQRRIINMLVSMSSVVLLISFVMAAALIRSEDRLNSLEHDLSALTNAYVNIIHTLQATQEAFAMEATPVLIEEDGATLVNEEESFQPEPEPEPTPAPPPVAAPQAVPVANLSIPQTYVVQPGDNLLAISQMFFGTSARVDEIMELNNIENPNMIFQGMILILPE